MTRINASIHPVDLTDRHLIAEWREIVMVPASLKRSLRTRSKEDIQRTLPVKFTLNKGHVSFFYNKLLYLKTRMSRLEQEMVRRGYSPDTTRYDAFDGIETVWFGDWDETPEAGSIVSERISLRISQKPHLYRNTTERMNT